MTEDTRTPAQRARDDSEREIFGEDPLRGPDGAPMERGRGSAYESMTPSAKAHFHALQAHAATDEVIGLAKQLTDAVGRLAVAHEEAVTAAQEAKVAAVPKPEPQTTSEVMADARAREQADAEAEQEKKRAADADAQAAAARSRRTSGDGNRTGA